MKTALTSLIAAVFVLAGVHANADAYSASIDGCKTAAAERLGLTPAQADFRITKIKSSPRYRDFDFSVSSSDAASPIKQVPVSCRAKQNGEVLAVDVDESALPAAVAVLKQ
jgi:hypothetical protein